MKEQRRTLYRAEWKGNMWVAGDTKKKHKRAREKKRSSKTQSNKVTRIKKKYRRLSKSNSFIEKYPTAESFVRSFHLREVK